MTIRVPCMTADDLLELRKMTMSDRHQCLHSDYDFVSSCQSAEHLYNTLSLAMTTDQLYFRIIWILIQKFSTSSPTCNLWYSALLYHYLLEVSTVMSTFLMSLNSTSRNIVTLQNKTFCFREVWSAKAYIQQNRLTVTADHKTLTASIKQLFQCLHLLFTCKNINHW